MGRYYSRKKGTLYIYVTGGNEMIDLKLFPPELKLFEPESAWRISNRIAVVHDVAEGSLDQAETILNLGGFRRRNLEDGLLESYFALGNETALEGLPVLGRPLVVRREPQMEPVEEGVIMPEVAKALEEVPPLIPPEITPIEMEPPTVEPSMAEGLVVPGAIEEGELIEHIMRYVESRGFVFPERLVKNFYISLKTKPFVILTGYSGMGKTALTRLMAEAVTDEVEEQYLRVSVQPNWLDDKRLMGFYNPLTEKYVSTPFLNYLLKAADNPDKPYFLCLDNLNLSRAEYYLTRILSAVESLDREVSLHGMLVGIKTEDGRPVPPKVKMPENLFITGTINIDESTYPLSPKLLDRANIIEFYEVDLHRRPKAEEYQRRLVLDMGKLSRFLGTLRPSEEELVIEALVEANEKTIKRGFPVSYRVRQEVLEYVANSRGIYSSDEEENLKAALDIQVKQRVLTKIAGTESVCPLLEELLEYFEGRMPLSAEKVERMLERLEELGFTSFYV